MSRRALDPDLGLPLESKIHKVKQYKCVSRVSSTKLQIRCMGKLTLHGEAVSEPEGAGTLGHTLAREPKASFANRFAMVSAQNEGP